MSTLSDLFAQLESSGGANAANQPASMANPTYGQYPAFVQQFGSGAAGVDNFASQAVANNPNLTVGDAYAEYYSGTGTPGSGASFVSLPSNVQANFLNSGANPTELASAAMAQQPGITVSAQPDYSVAQDFSGGTSGAGSGASDLSTSIAMGDNPYTAGLGYTSDVPTASTNASTAGMPLSIGDVSNAIGSTSNAITGGFNALSGSIGGGISTAITAVENWFGRGLVIVLAIVLAVVALFMLAMHSKTVQTTTATAVKALA